MDQYQHEEPKRPRIFYGWYIVAGSFVTNLALTGTYFQGFQVFFLPILTTFAWSRTALSGVFTLRQLESGVLAPVLGFIVDRVGPKRVIIVGGVISGFGMMALSQASSLYMFYALFLLAAVGASAASHGITWPVLVARWFRRRLGIAMGIATMGPFLSGIPVLIITRLVVETGWRTAMFITGTTLLLIITPIGAFVRNTPEPYGLFPDGDSGKSRLDAPKDRDHGGGNSFVQEGFTVSQALRQKSFWVCALFFGIFFFGTSAFGVHQIPYFESKGLSTSDAASTLTTLLFLSGIGRLGGGLLADAFDLRIVLTVVGILNLATWLYLVLFDVNSLSMALPFTALHGISFGFGVSLRPVIVTKLFGIRALGALNGLLQTSAVISGVVGPVLMGWIFDTTGEYTDALYLFIIVATLLLPISWFLKIAPERATSR